MNTMSKGATITVAILAIIAVSAISVVSYCIQTNNLFVAIEAGLSAQYSQCQNNLSSYSNKIAEVAQVPAMYRDDFSKVLSSELTARYGADGSKASFQWLQEHEVNFDSSMYAKIQNMIETGRNQFEAEQQLLIERKRQYTTLLGTFPRGWVAQHMLSFPKLNLDSLKLVRSGYAEDAFAKGREDGVTFRK